MNQVTIIGYSQKNIKIYTEQLQTLFDNTLNLTSIIAYNLDYIKFIQADIVLIPDDRIYKDVMYKVSETTKIITYDRTLTLDGIQMLMHLKTSEPVYVVDQEQFMSSKLITIFNKLGIRHLKFKAISYNALDDIDEGIVISCSNDELNLNQKHFDVGEVLLEFDAIIEVALLFNLHMILVEKDLTKTYKPTRTTHTGLTNLFNRLNKYESTVLILFDNIDYGYVELDLDRQLYFCNKNAIRILEVNSTEYKGTPIEHFIDQRLMDIVYQDKKDVIDEIIRLNDESIIVSIYPNINAGKFFGATVVMNQFSESEKKHNEIRNKIILKGHKAKYTFDDIIGFSDQLERSKTQAINIAHSSASVVIEGETGTGKELFAHAIHNHSPRKNYPFVSVNCGALPADILESELFGHEEGAFTGAKKGGKIGLFEMAHKGTIFLDEIGEMPVYLQMKLLRVLQEKEILKIGGDSVQPIDIRVISATNKNLESLVEEGLFREDLYYRLKVLPLFVPPLRDRSLDIIQLHDYYKKQLGGTYTLTDHAKSALLSHNWKGNIRELRNYVEYFTCMYEAVITEDMLPFRFQSQTPSSKDMSTTFDKYLELSGNDIEKYNKVLHLFHQSYYEKKRLGRRTILESLSTDSFFITEQEIRRMLKELEDLSIISIGKGRKGSQLTAFGLSFINLVENSS